MVAQPQRHRIRMPARFHRLVARQIASRHRQPHVLAVDHWIVGGPGDFHLGLVRNCPAGAGQHWEVLQAVGADVDIAEVVAFLRDEKPPLTHVVLTGRNAGEALIEAADLVTEMTLVKHPFRSGIKAQIGVEF